MPLEPAPPDASKVDEIVKGIESLGSLKVRQFLRLCAQIIGCLPAKTVSAIAISFLVALSTLVSAAFEAGRWSKQVEFVGAAPRSSPASSTSSSPEPFVADVWSVEGELNWPDNAHGPLLIRLQPSEQQIEDNTFTVTFARLPNHAGRLRFPKLTFSGQELKHSPKGDRITAWTAEPVDLEYVLEHNLATVDHYNKFIKLARPVTLNRGSTIFTH